MMSNTIQIVCNKYAEKTEEIFSWTTKKQSFHAIVTEREGENVSKRKEEKWREMKKNETVNLFDEWG